MSDQETTETMELNPELVKEEVAKTFSDPEAQELASKFLDGELDDKFGDRLKEHTPDHEAVMENLARIYKGDYTRIAQAIGVVALKVEHGDLAWWKAAQKVGLGNPDKERSGGGGARQRYLAVLGDESGDEKLATQVAGRARQKRVEQEAELKAIEKGGGWFELNPPHAEVGDKVHGGDNVPEGYTIVNPEDVSV